MQLTITPENFETAINIETIVDIEYRNIFDHFNVEFIGDLTLNQIVKAVQNIKNLYENRGFTVTIKQNKSITNIDFSNVKQNLELLHIENCTVLQNITISSRVKNIEIDSCNVVEMLKIPPTEFISIDIINTTINTIDCANIDKFSCDKKSKVINFMNVARIAHIRLEYCKIIELIPIQHVEILDLFCCELTYNLNLENLQILNAANCTDTEFKITCPKIEFLILRSANIIDINSLSTCEKLLDVKISDCKVPMFINNKSVKSVKLINCSEINLSNLTLDQLTIKGNTNVNMDNVSAHDILMKIDMA